MGFDVVPVNLNVVVLEAFGAFLFEELQMVVIREVAEGAVFLLWGVACGVGSYVVDMHGDRPPIGDCMCVRAGRPCKGGLKNLLSLW